MRKLLLWFTAPLRKHDFEAVPGIFTVTEALNAGYRPMMYFDPLENPYERGMGDFLVAIGSKHAPMPRLAQLMVCSQCGVPAFYQDLLDREEFNFFYRMRGCCGYQKQWPGAMD